MNEVWGPHLFLSLSLFLCGCVCVKLTRQLAKIGARSLYSNNTNIEWLPLVQLSTAQGMAGHLSFHYHHHHHDHIITTTIITTTVITTTVIINIIITVSSSLSF
jgi:hypothetical protein